MKLTDAITELGNRLAVAKKLGISRMNVSYWGYWIPKKHAQDLSFSTRLNYSKDLYDGKVTIKVNGKTYKAAPEIASRQILKKEVLKNAPLFFYRSESDLICAKHLTEKELYDSFKTHPIYLEKLKNEH